MNGLGRTNEEKNSKSSLIFTKETLGVVLVLFATLSLLCLITGATIFSAPGYYISVFFYGMFGYFAYPFVILMLGIGVTFIAGKKLPVSKKIKVLSLLCLLLIAFIAQVATMYGKDLSFGEYLSKSFVMGKNGIAGCSGGGIVFALFTYPVSLILSEVGTLVVFGIFLAIDVYALIVNYINSPIINKKSSKFNSSYVESPIAQEVDGIVIEGERDYPVDGVNIVNDKPAQKLFVSNPSDFALKSNRELKKGDNAFIKLGLSSGGLNVSTTSESYSKSYGEDLKKKIDYIKTPTVIDVEKTLSVDYSSKPKSIIREEDGDFTTNTTVSDYIPVREQPAVVEEESEIPFIEHEEMKEESAQLHANSFEDKYLGFEEVVGKVDDVIENVEEEVVFRPIEPMEIENTKIIEPVLEEIPLVEEEKFVEEAKVEEIQAPPQSNVIGRRQRGIFFGEEKTNAVDEQVENQSKTEVEPIKTDFTGGMVGRSRGLNLEAEKKEIEPEKKQKPQPPINRKYNRPPLDLLQTYEQMADQASENHEEKMEIIQRTLEEFHINAIPQSYVQGPSITRYEIMMPAGVSVKKVLGFDDDLKMRLASRNGVRIEAPIPGKNLVGIEVANKHKVTVGLKQVIEGMVGKKIKPGALEFAIGKDIVGNSISDDLAKGPHYLVAGATGSGKSVCLNAMIVSLIMRYSPEDLRLILIDPKRVGFRCYEHLPHLMIDEIITEPKRALAVLTWAYNEMEKRYETFENSPGVISNIQAYNEEVASATVPKMPRIVIIVDELADLMETCKKDMEVKIRALAQKSRAAGIHLVLATQRPSVDIITGTIKANLPSRIALKVMNFQDSQTILSEGGAEKLLGNGDMLYKNSGMAGYERYQGAWISDAEINNVVSYIIEKNASYFDDELQEFLDKETKVKQEENSSFSDETANDPNEINDFFLKALWLAVTSGSVSIAQLQRRFQIGYARAGGLVDKMERMGFVSANEGSKARRVLLTKEEFVARFGHVGESY